MDLSQYSDRTVHIIRCFAFMCPGPSQDKRCLTLYMTFFIDSLAVVSLHWLSIFPLFECTLNLCEPCW